MKKFGLVILHVWLLSDIAGAASVTLGWDENVEPDIAGYIIYYGTASGNYTESKDAGNTNRLTIEGLQEGVTYFFAATAYDTSQNESAYSEELKYTIPKKTDRPPIAPINIYIEKVILQLEVISK